MSLPDDHRSNGALPIARNVDLDMPGGLGERRLGTGAVADIGRITLVSGTVLAMPQVLGHFLAERGFQHALGELLQQPLRPGQGQPSSATRTNSRAASSSAEGSGFFFGLTASSVVITAPLGGEVEPGPGVGGVGTSERLDATEGFVRR